MLGTLAIIAALYSGIGFAIWLVAACIDSGNRYWAAVLVFMLIWPEFVMTVWRGSSNTK